MTEQKKATARSAGAVDKIIGARVRARRLQMGMTQEALADQIGVTFQQVQKYEKGLNRVAAPTLLEMAEALNTPVTWLLPEVRQGRGASALDDPDIAAFVPLLLQLNKDGRRALAAIARTLIKDPKLGSGAPKQVD